MTTLDPNIERLGYRLDIKPLPTLGNDVSEFVIVGTRGARYRLWRCVNYPSQFFAMNDRTHRPTTVGGYTFFRLKDDVLEAVS